VFSSQIQFQKVTPDEIIEKDYGCILAVIIPIGVEEIRPDLV
jgi:hypothetical protein